MTGSGNQMMCLHCPRQKMLAPLHVDPVLCGFCSSSSLPRFKTSTHVNSECGAMVVKFRMSWHDRERFLKAVLEGFANMKLYEMLPWKLLLQFWDTLHCNVCNIDST